MEAFQKQLKKIKANQKQRKISYKLKQFDVQTKIITKRVKLWLFHE